MIQDAKTATMKFFTKLKTLNKVVFISSDHFLFTYSFFTAFWFLHPSLIESLWGHHYPYAVEDYEYRSIPNIFDI